MDARSGWSDSEHNIPKAAKQLVTHMTEDSQQFGTRTSGVLQYAKEVSGLKNQISDHDTGFSAIWKENWWSCSTG